ncbi:hypothetical protein AAHE18_05G164800 [Arachis hypogaea]
MHAISIFIRFLAFLKSLLCSNHFFGTSALTAINAMYPNKFIELFRTNAYDIAAPT